MSTVPRGELRQNRLHEKLSAILTICQRMNSVRDLGALLDLVAREATRLLDAGFDVSADNRTRPKAEPLGEKGADHRGPELLGSGFWAANAGTGRTPLSSEEGVDTSCQGE